jgi:hypothetical protein
MDIEVVPRNDAFTTIAQLMHNVSWIIDSDTRSNNDTAEAARTLRRLAAEVAALAPLDVPGTLPLGYAVTARRH